MTNTTECATACKTVSATEAPEPERAQAAPKQAPSAVVQPSSAAAAVEALRAGKAIVFPTDTVYGIGVSVLHAQSPQLIYDIKRRTAGKPVAWLVGSPDALNVYGVAVPEQAERLARAHWPGGLTLIVKASAAVPRSFASSAGTVGLRMPANETALSIIRALGCPVATSSANLSGNAAPASLGEVDGELLQAVAAAVSDDAPRSGMASTVIDCSKGELTIVRQGAIQL